MMPMPDHSASSRAREMPREDEDGVNMAFLEAQSERWPSEAGEGGRRRREMMLFSCG